MIYASVDFFSVLISSSFCLRVFALNRLFCSIFSVRERFLRDRRDLSWSVGFSSHKHDKDNRVVAIKEFRINLLKFPLPISRCLCTVFVFCVNAPFCQKSCFFSHAPTSLFPHTLIAWHVTYRILQPPPFHPSQSYPVSSRSSERPLSGYGVGSRGVPVSTLASKSFAGGLGTPVDADLDINNRTMANHGRYGIL